MTAQVFVNATQPVSSGQPAYGVPCGSAGTVLTSNGVDQQPTFQPTAGSTAGGSPNSVQYNNAGAFGGIGPGFARQSLITPTDNAAPVWAGASGCRVRNSANQATSNVSTVISFDTELFDTDNYHSGGNPTRLTAPFTGLYDISAGIQFSAGGFIQLLFRVNGSALVLASVIAPAVNAGANSVWVLSAPYQLNAGDYVEVYGLNTSGGNIVQQDCNPWFAMMFRGP